MLDLLQNAITSELENKSLKTVSSAREELTERYRNQTSKKTQFITTQSQRYAYLATRMPATYAVIRRVLLEAEAISRLDSITSLLDLGAGPGTVMWAACEAFPQLGKLTLIEQDRELISIGKKLAFYSEHNPIIKAQWETQNLENLKLESNFDLITFSYSIGELSASTIPIVIEKCWDHTNKLLVIIEPGTPAGFERIRLIRKQILSLGGHIIAPCTHYKQCPMKNSDWCHFSERVERSSLHRRLKQASMNHEDEKFSYIIFSKDPYKTFESRILTPPLKRSGHIVLNCCTPEGQKLETISKKTPEKYKEARKLDWGSTI